jgi:hypothetical protein
MTYFDILDLKNTFEVINAGLLPLHNIVLAFYETKHLTRQPIDLTIHGLDLTCQAFLLLWGDWRINLYNKAGRAKPSLFYRFHGCV